MNIDMNQVKLQIVASTLAENWCATRLWVLLADELSTKSDQDRLRFVFTLERKQARSGITCWNCVDACNVLLEKIG